MRNLFRLKVTDRGNEVFAGHSVADDPFDALTTIKPTIKGAEGALLIEVEMVGEVAITTGSPVSTSREPT
jgi:hypothetical protein